MQTSTSARDNKGAKKVQGKETISNGLTDNEKPSNVQRDSHFV